MIHDNVMETKTTKTENTFVNSKYNMYYVRIANLVHQLSAQNKEELMNVVKEIASESANLYCIFDPTEYCYTSELEEVYDDIIKKVGMRLASLLGTPSSISVFNTLTPLYENNITDETCSIYQVSHKKHKH